MGPLIIPTLPAQTRYCRVERQSVEDSISLKSKCITPMAHFLLLSYSFEQMFAAVLPSSRELSSEAYSFQLDGKGKPMQVVPAPHFPSTPVQSRAQMMSTPPLFGYTL